MSHIKHKQKLEHAIDVIESEKRDFIAKNPKSDNEDKAIKTKRNAYYTRIEAARSELRVFNLGVDRVNG